jgi:DNA-binding NtrC family response regulator
MSGKNGSILIVDDEEAIRSLLKYSFEKDGYEVHLAGNGLEALNVLEEVKIDVAISDIVMPEIDGVELVKRMRAEFPMTRIIMMTGYVNIENLLICVQNQVDTVIFKPFESLDEMKAAVIDSINHINHWQSKLQEFESFFGKSPIN